MQCAGIETYLLQQRGNGVVDRRSARARVQDTERAHAFADDFADRQTRIERGERILEDHLHTTPQRAQGVAP
jgi:hypothetical protein